MTSSNHFSLTGKVALITGGGRGIGKGIAHAFAEAGAAVALVARTKEQIDAVAEEINGSGGRAIAIAADVNDLEIHGTLLTETIGAFGALDTVVNCAGGGDMWRPFLDDSGDDIESAFHFNVAVPIELVRLAVPQNLRLGIDDGVIEFDDLCLKGLSVAQRYHRLRDILHSIEGGNRSSNRADIGHDV